MSNFLKMDSLVKLGRQADPRMGGAFFARNHTRPFWAASRPDLTGKKKLKKKLKKLKKVLTKRGKRDIL